MDHHEEEESTEKKVKLLGMWLSPYVLKVIWALNIKGVEYDYIEEDLKNKSDQLLEHNPVHKKVPVLIRDGKAVAESDVILEFIDEAWSHRGGGRILPDDPYQRAIARFWARFAHDTLSPPIWKWFTTEGEEQEAAHDAAVEQLLVLEEELGDGRRFFAGESVGLVDLSLGAMSYVIPMYEEIIGVRLITEERLPKFSAWMGRFLSSPAVMGHPPPLDTLKLRYQAMRQAFLKS